MKTGKFILFAAAVLSLVACGGEGPTPVSFTPKAAVSGADLKDNAIDVNSDAHTVALSVVANESWTLESSADWAVVSPSAKVIEDEKEATTSVSLSIVENAGDERTATLTFKAKDVNDVVITVKQAKHAFNPSAEIEGDAIQSGKIAATYEGGTFSFKVVANVSWTFESSQDWAKLDPASAAITDEQSKETAITLTVDPNTGDARKANITLKAEGAADKTIVVEQSKDENYLAVLDENETPVTEIEASPTGQTVAIVVDASAKPEVVSSADWITLATDNSFTPGEYWNISINIAANFSAEAREGTVTFSLGKLAPVVVRITQECSGTITMKADDISYRNAYVKVDPGEDTELSYFFNYLTKEIYDEYVVMAAEYGYSEDIIPTLIISYLADYNKMTVKELLPYLLESGAQWFNLADHFGVDLDPETEYVAFAQFFDETGPLSKMATCQFTTLAVPSAKPEYSSIVGTYNLNCLEYDYSNVSSKFVPTGETLALKAVIEENDINESFKISFPENNNISPISSAGNYDRYPLYFGFRDEAETMPVIQWPFAAWSDKKGDWSFTISRVKYSNCSLIWMPIDPETLYYVLNDTQDNYIPFFLTPDGSKNLNVYYPDPVNFVMCTMIVSGDDIVGSYGTTIMPVNMERTGDAPAKASKASAEHKALKCLGLENYKHMKRVKAAEAAGKDSLPLFKNYTMRGLEMPRNYVEIR